MKKQMTLLTLAIMAVSLGGPPPRAAVTKTLTFTWSPGSGQTPLSYNLYETTTGTNVLVASTTNLTVAVPGVNTTIARTYCATTVDAIGDESIMSAA